MNSSQFFVSVGREGCLIRKLAKGKGNKRLRQETMELAQVIERNNVAVEMLQDGDCCEASAVLQVALLELQNSFRSVSEEEEAPWDSVPIRFSQGSTANDPTFGLPEGIQQADSLETKHTLYHGMPVGFQGNNDADACADCLLLYDRAFCIYNGESRERVVSAILLYNCGLSRHVQAIRLGDSQDLIRALRMYEAAFRIIRDQPDANGSTALLVLALCNNLGHVNFQLFRLDDAKHCVKCLREEMGLSDENPFGSELPLLEDEDYNFFSFNLAIQVELTAAPAA